MSEKVKTLGAPSSPGAGETREVPCVEYRRALAGLLVRRECWTLSRRAKLLVLAFMISAVWLAIRFVHPFLAVTHRANSNVLVVEGWIPSYAVREAIAEFRTGGYQQVLTCGGPTHEDSTMRMGSTYADWGAARLFKQGLSHDLITPIPSHVERKDRTFYSAMALKQWLEASSKSVSSIDVLTVGPHARRTRLLFEKALGAKVKVGIIAAATPDYDPDHWWRSSEGVREVVGEAIAYVYARIFFHPSRDREQEKNEPTQGGL